MYERYFRDELGHLTAGAALMFRGLSRPLGYAGDYETMRMCYDDGYEGTTLLGKMMHKYTTEFTRSQAVRNRRELIAQFAKGKKSIMSGACGPAAEVALIAAQNPGGLSHSSCWTKIRKLWTLHACTWTSSRFRIVRISYENISVYSIIKDNNVQLGGFDLIYSMGLFDYLNDKAAKKLCLKLLNMLNPNGALIIGNFHVRCPNRYFIQYWCDWPLYYRTEASMYDMIPTNGGTYDSTIFYEHTKSQMFLRIQLCSSKL